MYDRLSEKERTTALSPRHATVTERRVAMVRMSLTVPEILERMQKDHFFRGGGKSAF
jgi:hypothetical protein